MCNHLIIKNIDKNTRQDIIIIFLLKGKIKWYLSSQNMWECIIVKHLLEQGVCVFGAYLEVSYLAQEGPANSSVYFSMTDITRFVIFDR